VATPNYVDLVMFKTAMGITRPTDDGLATMALSAASRSVDKFCQRRFWLDPIPVTRTFVPSGGLLYLDLWANDSGNDIGALDGLTVATDTSGDGTFDTEWSLADYQILPVNASYADPNPEPWTAIRAVGRKTFPWLVNTWLTHLNRVAVTARWGWPAVPDDVIQATMIKASRLYHRKDSPSGVLGFGEYGVKLSPKEDPDVILLLTDYQRAPVLVA
jgi:hypothetical protein